MDVPPPGPPPPKVPEGWKAVWNEQYKEWFYVNIYTKTSTWDKPTVPARNPNADAAPSGPPPSYTGSGTTGSEKLNPNNPYNTTAASTSQADIDADARYAAQLQAEEDARAASSAGNRGAGAEYYNSSSSPGLSTPSYDQQLPPRDAGNSKGVMGKLLGKLGGSHSRPQQQQQQGYGPPGYGQPGYGQPGYPQQGFPPPQNYGGYPQQQQAYYAPGYAAQPQYQQSPKKSAGLGPLGGAALGLGGGLIGGMMLEDAIQDHDQNEYQQGFQQGQMSNDGMGNTNYGDGGMEGDYGDNNDNDMNDMDGGLGF